MKEADRNLRQLYKIGEIFGERRRERLAAPFTEATPGYYFRSPAYDKIYPLQAALA